jgi:hypothetical protein
LVLSFWLPPLTIMLLAAIAGWFWSGTEPSEGE